MTEPIEDPIIREVHEARAKIAEEAAEQGKGLGEYLMELQRRRGRKLVSRPPRKIVRSKTA